MWRRCVATIDGVAVEKALVDFSGRVPENIELAVRMPLNTPVIIGETEFFTGRVEPIGRMFVTTLMAAPLLPKEEAVDAAAVENAAVEAEIAADKPKPMSSKGRKK